MISTAAEREPASSVSIMAALVVAGTMLFNAALELVNAHAMAVGHARVAAVRAALTASGLVIALEVRPAGTGLGAVCGRQDAGSCFWP